MRTSKCKLLSIVGRDAGQELQVVPIVRLTELGMPREWLDNHCQAKFRMIAEAKLTRCARGLFQSLFCRQGAEHVWDVKLLLSGKLGKHSARSKCRLLAYSSSQRGVLSGLRWWRDVSCFCPTSNKTCLKISKYVNGRSIFLKNPGVRIHSFWAEHVSSPEVTASTHPSASS